MSEPQRKPDAEVGESAEGYVDHICENNCDTYITKFDHISVDEIIVRAYKDVCRICGKEFPVVDGLNANLNMQNLFKKMFG